MERESENHYGHTPLWKIVPALHALQGSPVERRGDAGVFRGAGVKDGKRQQSQYEIDFVVNTGREKVYIQSALNVDAEEKRSQETFSLKNSGDFFRKIVIVDGNEKPWTDENGIMYMGVIPFLLEENLI